MFSIHLLFAFLTALILSSLFAVVFRRTAPGQSVFILFMLIFLISWAGGVLLTHMGLPLRGVYWLPFILVGLMIALLLAAIPLRRKGASAIAPVDVMRRKKEERVSHMVVGTFFWIVVMVLIGGLVFLYI